MNSLRGHFLTLLTNIEPKSERLDLATDLPSKIRDFLKDSEKITTVEPHTRLSGSYARDTAIKQIKDVDILLFVDAKYKNGEDSTKTVISKLVNALGGLPKAIGDENGQVELKRQRRSVLVHVTLSGEEFDMDIVPSIYERKSPSPLEVPDRDLSKWILSDPLGYKQSLSNINQEQNGKIIPLIKMFKHWRDVKMKYRKPKSYWLECIVYKHTKANNLKIEDASHGELFHSLLASIYNDFVGNWEKEDSVPVIKDPMLDNNVAKSWTRIEFETFMRRIEESMKWAERALEAEEEEKSIELWQKIFNDDDSEEDFFPTTIDGAMQSILDRKAVYVSFTGQVFGQKPSSEIVLEAKSHRYFGG